MREAKRAVFSKLSGGRASFGIKEESARSEYRVGFVKSVASYSSEATEGKIIRGENASGRDDASGRASRGAKSLDRVTTRVGCTRNDRKQRLKGSIRSLSFRRSKIASKLRGDSQSARCFNVIFSSYGERKFLLGASAKSVSKSARHL